MSLSFEPFMLCADDYSSSNTSSSDDSEKSSVYFCYLDIYLPPTLRNVKYLFLFARLKLFIMYFHSFFISHKQFPMI